jgi:hypothetical protein
VRRSTTFARACSGDMYADLQRDVAFEAVVAGAIHLAHATAAQMGDDLEDADARAGRQFHV